MFTGLKRIVSYILYGVLVLLMLILLMIMGVNCMNLKHFKLFS